MDTCKLGFYNSIVSMKDINWWFAWFSISSMIIWVGVEHLLNMLVKDDAKG